MLSPYRASLKSFQSLLPVTGNKNSSNYSTL